ncbi:MAG: hypothetical protein R3C12_13710 [Planctomycetaceae bacterium]
MFEQSHRQPVTDRLVYNPLQSGGEKAVRDLMVELDILPEAVQSQFQIRMHDGQYTFLVLLDFATQRGELRLEGNDSVLHGTNSRVAVRTAAEAGNVCCLIIRCCWP